MTLAQKIAAGLAAWGALSVLAGLIGGAFLGGVEEDAHRLWTEHRTRRTH